MATFKYLRLKQDNGEIVNTTTELQLDNIDNSDHDGFIGISISYEHNNPKEKEKNCMISMEIDKQDAQLIILYLKQEFNL